MSESTENTWDIDRSLAKVMKNKSISIFSHVNEISIKEKSFLVKFATSLTKNLIRVSSIICKLSFLLLLLIGPLVASILLVEYNSGNPIVIIGVILTMVVGYTISYTLIETL